jgi:hypothetical protein
MIQMGVDAPSQRMLEIFTLCPPAATGFALTARS